MDLRLYLFEKRLSVVKFAKQVGISRDHLSNVMHGYRNPSKTLARVIEMETHGMVKVADMRKDMPRKKRVVKPKTKEESHEQVS